MITQVEELVFADATFGVWFFVGPIVVQGTNGPDLELGTDASEQFFGLDGDDTLRGGREEDDFIGGRGNDILDGGGPNDPNNDDDANFAVDSVNYASEYSEAINASIAPEGVAVNLSNQAATITFGGAPLTLAAGTAKDVYGDTDTLIEIERIYGTGLGDYLVGSAGDDRFDPFGGDDTIVGGAGFDSLNYHLAAGMGGTGAISVQFSATTAGSGTVLIDPFGDTDIFTGIEQVRATQGNDTLMGGAGSQRFRAYAGDDTIDGGADRDFLSYNDSANYRDSSGNLGTGGITVTLASNSIIDAWGDTDTVFSIESIRGTGAADGMFGDAMDNTFEGEAGDDTLSGGAGQATFSGGSATTRSTEALIAMLYMATLARTR